MRDNPKRMALVVIGAFVVLFAGAGAYAVMQDNSTHGSMAGTGGMSGMDGMDQPSGTALETNGQPYDQAFIDNMVPHHEGAVEMAKIELAKGRRAEVKQFATQVVSAQNAEIKRMKALRAKWYGSSSTPAEMPMSMPGMDVAGVREANDVDRAFVEMMISHHESAIAMATDAEAKGTHREIRALAATIAVDQANEVAQMKEWKKSW